MQICFGITTIVIGTSRHKCQQEIANLVSNLVVKFEGRDRFRNAHGGFRRDLISKTAYAHLWGDSYPQFPQVFDIVENSPCVHLCHCLLFSSLSISRAHELKNEKYFYRSMTSERNLYIAQIKTKASFLFGFST